MIQELFMRIAVLNTNKPSEAVYIQKDIYFGNKNGNNRKRTTKIVAKLGKTSDLMAQLNMSNEEFMT